MRLVFCIFLFSQLLNFLGVFAENFKKDSYRINKVIWEKVDEKQSRPLKKIIWKSYKGEENYFKNENEEVFSENQFDGPKEDTNESKTWRNRILRFSFEEIDMPDVGEFMGFTV